MAMLVRRDMRAENFGACPISFGSNSPAFVLVSEENPPDRERQQRCRPTIPTVGRAE